MLALVLITLALAVSRFWLQTPPRTTDPLERRLRRVCVVRRFELRRVHWR